MSIIYFIQEIFEKYRKVEQRYHCNHVKDKRKNDQAWKIILKIIILAEYTRRKSWSLS